MVTDKPFSGPAPEFGSPRPQVASWRGVGVALLIGGLIGAVATVGFDPVYGVSRMALLAPVGALAALAMGMCALSRFEVFLYTVLLVRPSLDIIKAGTGALEPTAAVGVGVVLAGLAWLVSQRMAVGPRPRTPLATGALTFTAVTALAVLGSPSPGTSGVEFARIASVLMMLLILERLFRDRPERLGPALVAAYGSLLVPAMVAAYQWMTGTGTVVDEFVRISGTFVHPNSFAMYLVVLLVGGVALLPHLDGAWRYGLLGATAVSAACLLATYMRGAWLATLVGVLVVGALQSRRMFIGVLVAGAVAVVLVPGVQARFADLAEPQQETGDAANSLAWRVQHWEDSLALADERRVTGIGLRMVQEATEGGKAPHNDFIRTIVEMGLLGFAAYIMFLAGLIRTAVRAVRASLEGLERGVAVASAGLVAALITLSMSDNVVSQVVVLWYFAVFLAGASALAARAEGGARASASDCAVPTRRGSNSVGTTP